MAWGICDRCGFRYHLHQLRKEWTGLMVCERDWDPRPAELSPPCIKPEGLPLPNARPEPADLEFGPGSFDPGIFDAVLFDTRRLITEDDL